MATQIKSFLLPLTVLLVVPLAILFCTRGFRIGWVLGLPYDIIIAGVGFTIVALGLYLLIRTIALFVTLGKGTLAPWAPPQKLVVTGPYRYARNPMISGVLIALLGESIVFGSVAVLVWFLLFFVANHIYFIFSEEPGLVRRFGHAYIQYRNNVPRWVPKLRSWMPDQGEVETKCSGSESDVDKNTMPHR